MYWNFLPEWIRMCARKSLCCANERLQVSQAYGRSPVWVRWWIWRRKTRENPRPQCLHWCGFSPVWVLCEWGKEKSKMKIRRNYRLSSKWNMCQITSCELSGYCFRRMHDRIRYTGMVWHHCVVSCANLMRLSFWMFSSMFCTQTVVHWCESVWIVMVRLILGKNKSKILPRCWRTRVWATNSDCAQNDLLQYSHLCTFLLLFRFRTLFPAVLVLDVSDPSDPSFVDRSLLIGSFERFVSSSLWNE